MWYPTFPIHPKKLIARVRIREYCHMKTVCAVLLLLPHSLHWTQLMIDPLVQSTLPKSKSHKSNNRLSRRSIQGLSSPLFFIFYCFLPHISQIFSKSKSFLQSQWIRLRQSWLYFQVPTVKKLEIQCQLNLLNHHLLLHHRHKPKSHACISQLIASFWHTSILIYSSRYTADVETSHHCS